LDDDPIYEESARHLQYFVAAVLPLSYVIGLIYTLKTHAKIIDDPQYIDRRAAEEHQPAGPKWSKLKCIIVLLACTLMFGLLAEEIVKTLEPTLIVLGITEAFAGITIIAVVSYTAEFVNAIQFAIHNSK
jgi:Ca2+:H+ antiporter